MIENFLKKTLWIYTYSVKKHLTGKDNKTYEIILEEKKDFIVQQLSSSKTQENKYFIEQVISYVERNIPQVHFWWNYFPKRFFSFEWNDFQVMKKIPWNSIDISDIDSSVIKNTAKYLAHFHKWISWFSYKKFWNINNYKDMFSYREKARRYMYKCKDPEILQVFRSLDKKSQLLKEDLSLPIGVIHGDPAFKNFLIDEDKNIRGLIDYDMMSVSTILWDISDLVRSYLKLDSFDKKSFLLLIKSYNEIRKLTDKESSLLEEYCNMMTLNTAFRYIISYFENTNLLGWKQDCLKKSQRCLQELEKLNTFFI